ncbi:MAG: DUF6249 domain-containing protein [Burkholderiales bacterium]
MLGGALLAATLCAILPDPPPVRAAELLPVRMVVAQAATDAAREATTAAREAAREAATAAKDAAREAAAAAKDAADADAEEPAPRGRRHHGVRITGLGAGDRQYDSFDQFLDSDPALAAMVLGIVFIVFLTPILIIGLVIWYKMRKSRMQNEMMIKLAEKGIVPPADAIAAIGNDRVAPMVNAVAASAPLGEQVRVIRKAAAWSDLRKGVLMGTVGFALTLYAMFEDGSPSWLGLVLLFLGIGYIVLWYFEDRHAAPAPAETAPASPPGPGNPVR